MEPKTFLTPAMTLEALLGSLQCTCVVHLWRLPSLVCEHISYAAWCFSVTCFDNMSLLRAWLTNGIESLSCPPPSFSFFFLSLSIFLIIDFFGFSFLFFMTYVNGTLPHGRKKENKHNNNNTVRSHAKGRGHKWNGRVTSWPLWVRPNGTSVFLWMADVELRSCTVILQIQEQFNPSIIG